MNRNKILDVLLETVGVLQEMTVRQERYERNYKIPLTSEEMKQVHARFGTNLQCSFFKTKKGQYYACTHRCRTPYFDNIEDIPKARVKFVESTS